MAEGKKSFVAYADWKEVFDALPNEDAGALIKHIFSYVNDENPISDSVLINAVFANIKSTLKRDLQKWETQLEQRRSAGKKSAEIRSTKSNDRSNSLNETTRNPTVSVSVSENVNDNVILLEKETKDIIMEKTKRFIPPTYQEVFNYCRERNNKVDSQRFIDHYTSNGWMVGKTKMKDWKASVRTWEKNNLNTTANGPTAKQPIDWAERDKRFIEGVMGTGQSDTGSEGSNDQPFTSYQDVD